MEKVIEIPADAKTVTLELKKSSTFTLRTILPRIVNKVELVVKDVHETNSMRSVDLYRIRATSGKDLTEKLERSRVMDGEVILGLAPIIEAGAENIVRLLVEIPVPDEEG